MIRDVALGVIRREGAGFIHCIKALHDVDGFAVAEAKAAVHHSPSWEDDRAGREAFWEEVIAILQDETGPFHEPADVKPPTDFS